MVLYEPECLPLFMLLYAHIAQQKENILYFTNTKTLSVLEK